MKEQETIDEGQRREESLAKEMLFNFQRSEAKDKTFEIFEKAKATRKRGCSSAGRAPALQAGGHGFEPHHLHQSSRREDYLFTFHSSLFTFHKRRGTEKEVNEREA